MCERKITYNEIIKFRLSSSYHQSVKKIHEHNRQENLISLYYMCVKRNSTKFNKINSTDNVKSAAKGFRNVYSGLLNSVLKYLEYRFKYLSFVNISIFALNPL